MGNFELARDIVICISGVVVSIAVVFITVLVYVLYKKAKTVLTALEATSSTLYQMSAIVKEEVVEPVIRFAVMIRGIMSGIDFVTKFFQKREGRSDV